MKHIFVERKQVEIAQLLDQGQAELDRGDYEAFSTTLSKCRSGLEEIFFYEAHGRAAVDVLEILRWKNARIQSLMGGEC